MLEPKDLTKESIRRLKSACDQINLKSHYKIHFETALQKIKSGLWQLWASEQSIAVFCVNECPVTEERFLHIVLVNSSGGNELLQHADQVEYIARENRCDAIRFQSSRHGFTRKTPDGFFMSTIVYEKRI